MEVSRWDSWSKVAHILPVSVGRDRQDKCKQVSNVSLVRETYYEENKVSKHHGEWC